MIRFILSRTYFFLLNSFSSLEIFSLSVYVRVYVSSGRIRSYFFCLLVNLLLPKPDDFLLFIVVLVALEDLSYYEYFTTESPLQVPMPPVVSMQMILSQSRVP